MSSQSAANPLHLAINSRHASLLFLSLSWLFIPQLWLALTAVCLSGAGKKPNNIMPALIGLSLSLLIATRFIGFLWGGADDMPTYFMAYERYNNFSSMMATSLLYGKHADFLFALYSWGVANLTDNHLFGYYLVTLCLTYALVWQFCKQWCGLSAAVLFADCAVYKYFRHSAPHSAYGSAYFTLRYMGCTSALGRYSFCYWWAVSLFHHGVVITHLYLAADLTSATQRCN